MVGGSGNSMVIACPLGGQITIAGQVVDESVADTVRLRSDVTASPSGCQVSSGGMRFTVDGRPGVREQTITTFVGFFEAFSLEGSVTGALDWQSDGRSGSCNVELALSAELDSSGTEPSVAGALAGRLCGHETRFPVESTPDPSG